MNRLGNNVFFHNQNGNFDNQLLFDALPQILKNSAMTESYKREFKRRFLLGDNLKKGRGRLLAYRRRMNAISGASYNK